MHLSWIMHSVILGNQTWIIRDYWRHRKGLWNITVKVGALKFTCKNASLGTDRRHYNIPPSVLCSLFLPCLLGTQAVCRSALPRTNLSPLCISPSCSVIQPISKFQTQWNTWDSLVNSNRCGSSSHWVPLYYESHINQEIIHIDECDCN